MDQSTGRRPDDGRQEFPALSSDHIAIAWADTRHLTPAVINHWVAELPEVERARFTRFQHQGSAHEFLLGRRMVRCWLAALTGSRRNVWTFVEGQRGRPEIAAPATTLRFNLAHSGGVVACVMTDGLEAGVDVEDLQRRAVERDLWHRFCAPSEAADIERMPESARQRRFLTYWTLKEAYLKARGLGIAVHLADVAFDLSDAQPRITFRESLTGTDDRWYFGIRDVAPHHLVSWALPWSAPEAPVVAVASVDVRALEDHT